MFQKVIKCFILFLVTAVFAEELSKCVKSLAFPPHLNIPSTNTHTQKINNPGTRTSNVVCAVNTISPDRIWNMPETATPFCYGQYSCRNAYNTFV